MVITYQGGESIKISQGDLVVAVNPKSKTSADITLWSTGHHPLDEDRAGFVIQGPGEYEVKGIPIKGFLSKGPGEKLNTIYTLNIEGLNLCLLGSLSDASLSNETLEELEDIDILFIPVGGEGLLDPSEAYKLSVSLESSVSIPTSHTPESLKKFLKEAGEDKTESMDKLVVKKKDLDGKEGDIIVLREE